MLTRLGEEDLQVLATAHTGVTWFGWQAEEPASRLREAEEGWQRLVNAHASG